MNDDEEGRQAYKERAKTNAARRPQSSRKAKNNVIDHPTSSMAQ